MAEFGADPEAELEKSMLKATLQAALVCILVDDKWPKESELLSYADDVEDSLEQACSIGDAPLYPEVDDIEAIVMEVNNWEVLM